MDVHRQSPVLGTLDRQPGVAVHGALGPSRGPRGVEQHQGLVRRHRFGRHPATVGPHDVFPGNVEIPTKRNTAACAVDHHHPLQLGQAVRGLGGERLHGNRPTAADGGVGGDQHPGVRIGESLTNGLHAEAGEERDGDGAQLRTGQQGDGILDDQRQIQTHGDSPFDADGAKSCGGPLHDVLQPGVGQPSGVSVLGLADQRQAVRIGAPMPDHRRLVGVQPASGEPPGEWNSGRGVHHLAIRCRPDHAELLDQDLPEPARFFSRLLT